MMREEGTGGLPTRPLTMIARVHCMIQGVVVGIAMLSAACGPRLSPARRQLRVSDLRLSTQVSEWREKRGSFRRFTPQTLFDLIDGAAPEYNEHGLIEGIRQELQGPDGAEAEVFVFEFCTRDSAQTLLMARCRSSAGHAPLPGVETDMACGVPTLGGYAGYACRDKFFVEVVITGIPDHHAASAAAAVLIQALVGSPGR